MNKLRFKSLLFGLVVGVIAALSGCSTGASFDHSNAGPSKQSISESGRLLVKSARINLEVENKESVFKDIERELKAKAGIIVDVDDYDDGRVSMTLKVPADTFDLFIEMLSSKGKVLSKTVGLSDVTTKVLDIEARILNLKALRDRLRILLEKADKVSDVLAVERELTRVQIEIDSISARNNSLKDQVLLSRVDVTLTEKTIYGPLGYLSQGVFWVLEKLFVIK